MFNLGFLKNIGRYKLQTENVSPQVLMVLGTVGFVATTVLVYKAALKVDSVLEKAEEKMEKVADGHIKLDPAVYSEDDYNKDIAIVQVQKVVDLGLLFVPAVVVGAVSIGCFAGAHHILSTRNASIMAAYSILDRSFKAYRKRVESEVDPEKAYRLRHGIQEEEITEETVNEKGKKIKTKKMIGSGKPLEPSEYSKFFDDSCVQWRRDPTMNMFFLKTQQNWANEKLKSQGHLFLNEVYDMLSLPRTQAGSVVGWIYNEENPIGDNYVDFGIFDVNNPSARDFVNRYNNFILLDFNVDGLIWELL